MVRSSNIRISLLVHVQYFFNLMISKTQYSLNSKKKRRRNTPIRITIYAPKITQKEKISHTKAMPAEKFENKE